MRKGVLIMNKKTAIILTLTVASIISLYALFVSASSCDATGMYDCSSAGGDTDADGVCNTWEDFYGTDPVDLDTDGGLDCDGDELFLDGTDPLFPTDDL